MKTPTTTRLILALLSTAALIGLGGCATSVSKERVLELYPVGTSKLYGVVPGKPTRLSEIKEFDAECGNQPNQPEANKFFKEHICGRVDKWQLASIVYQTKVWGMEGLKYQRVYAPVDLVIDEDDILEASMEVLPDGRLARPSLVTRIARKAKDATKESGCYWDGGKGATTAFIGGGAVCDGWNWRDQKFAKE